ncbi:MAG: peptidoglycan bridge formation glycyltransferase FemA/FemB family protein [Candidatus Moraniibacteriota bacterium]
MHNKFENRDFLQSNEWQKFQEAVERKIFSVCDGDFSASIVEHSLPIVGKYLYIPHGPIISEQESINKEQFKKLLDLAIKNEAGWIRIDPENNDILKLIKKTIKNKIIKAPHDMQPKETLIMDISKSEEEILAGMKSKTRYNIKLAEKKGVKIAISDKKNIEEFLKLTKIMAERQGITTHKEKYYRKMFEIIPNDIIKLYVAEYDEKIIAANIVVFYEDTAYYLHGASDDKYKNLMAPYLLQWKQIQDARKANCTKYDFCGVKINEKKGRSWEGVTRFKLGFSPKTKPVEFPGSYDIIIDPIKYWLYRIIQKLKSLIK